MKLEVIGDQKTLFPDNEGLIEATRVLASEGFVVLPYTNDDLVNARKLIDAGAAAVMPLGAPIGSGLGIQNTTNLRILREIITEVPLIVDAGVGTASDAAIAMELGFDGVLMNTAIAEAEDSEKMAEAMKLAVQAGRLAYLAGRMPKKLYASREQSAGRRRAVVTRSRQSEVRGLGLVWRRARNAESQSARRRRGRDNKLARENEESCGCRAAWEPRRPFAEAWPVTRHDSKGMKRIARPRQDCRN